MRALYTWDSVNFAQAMRSFDVTRHAPHPPGYLWYVGLARLLDLLFRDANTSLVAISIGFTGLSAAALYLLGRTLFGRGTGAAAVVLMLTGVTFWAYGGVALSYMTLAFFSIAAAWAAARAIFPATTRHAAARPDDRFLLTLAFTLGGGFRPDLLLFLGPLWLAGMAGASWRERAFHGAVVAAGTALWFAPTVWLSGGLANYVAVFSAYLGRDVLDRYAVTNRGLAALWVNVRDLGAYFGYQFYAQAALLLPALAWLIVGGQWRERRWRLIGLWVAPAFVFYLLVHIGDPGYVFSITPAFCLLGGRFAVWLGERPWGRRSARPLALAALAVVLIVNIGLFVFYDKPLTGRGLRRHDRSLHSRLAYVQRTYPPDQVTLLSYMDFKHTRYYLPEHRESVWVDLFSRQQARQELAPGVRYVLLLEDRLAPLLVQHDRWERVTLQPGVAVHRLAVRGERELLYGHEGIIVR
jgi:4-amino-4-deoxy-L-arabinose transferase-like glycosyltransferase